MKSIFRFDEIWLNLKIHKLDETFIDSKYPGVVKLCQYLTNSHFIRIPYYDEIHNSGKNHHDEFNDGDQLHHADEPDQYC